jgi:peptidylprolyl isomerase
MSAPNNKYLVLKTRHGESLIELYPNLAPNHVSRILTLAEQNFYNGLKFHRVIDGFMAQTGCPKGDGTGGSPLSNVRAEFNDMKHQRGVVSMARGNDINSGNSQFFIMFQAAPYLDHQYTAFGKVIRGMDKIDLIQKGSYANDGAFLKSNSSPDIIQELYIPNEEHLAFLFNQIS